MVARILPALLISIAMAAGSTVPAAAIDPATVSGTLTVNGKVTELTHAVVVRHDDAEKLLDADELRILLADREIGADALYGIRALPIEDLARAGEVTGVLIRLDPASPGIAIATILAKPGAPGESFVMQTLSSSTKGQPLKQLKLGGTRVLGSIDWTDDEPMFPGTPRVTYKVEFSAPPFHEQAVSTELTGEAALASPQLAALAEWAAALSQGDLAKVRQASTERANARRSEAMALFGKGTLETLKPEGPRWEKKLPTVQKIVVRKTRAVVIFPENYWRSLELVGGNWLSDD